MNSFEDRSISASPRQTWRVAGIEAQVADLHHRRALDRAAADEGTQAGEQLGEGERLDQVIVGAAVEAGDPIVEGAARGQHQDRRPDAVAAQAPAGLEAVDPGQHHVEDDGVVVGGARHQQGALAFVGDVDVQPFLAQPATQQGRHLHLVLDDQDLHRMPRSCT